MNGDYEKKNGAPGRSIIGLTNQHLVRPNTKSRPIEMYVEYVSWPNLFAFARQFGDALMAKRSGRFEDFTGMRFNYLTALERVFVEGSKKTHWRCRCDCGNETRVNANSLKYSLIQSCGCKKRSTISRKHRRHGASKHKTYKSWSAMMRRCNNPKDSGYKYYGGNGITVCDRWHDYRNFLADMGERPVGMTIDRVDGSKGYSPDNCRWATMAVQNENKKSTHQIEAFGVTMTIRKWSCLTGIAMSALGFRLRRGMSPEEALTMKPRSIKRTLIDPTEFEWYRQLKKTG